MIAEVKEIEPKFQNLLILPSHENITQISIQAAI